MTAPAFFMRLDKLLKQIQRAGSRPDHHFLSTLLRHIPKFPASLDKACDLFHAALSLAQKEIVSHKSQAFSNTETSGLQLAASHGDLVLFERGKLEAVQLPWTPILAENPGRSLQSASTLTTNPSLDNELTQATLSSQQVRFALLRGELTEAVSAFQHMTHVIESIATPASGSSNWSDAGNAAYKTMQTMWIGLFVRLLSASLQRQDLSTSTNLVNLALDCLGSRWVGQQAMKRLFLAACSPKFHDQPHTLLRRRMSAAHVIHQQSFTRVLWTLRRWSEDMHANGSKPLALVVDEDMTSKQRMRSVLSRDTSSRILARATAMCLVPAMFANEAREAWPGAPQIYDSLDPIEVVQDVLSTMVALQVNCNFVKWWQRVERDVEEHMDAWSVPLHQRAGWRDKSNILAEMCAQMEAERLERTQVSRS